MGERIEGQLQTAVRVAKLLMLYLSHGPALGVRDAARLLNIHPSISQRLFASLASTGMLVKDSATGKYVLGKWVADLGALVAGSHSLRLLVDPYMVRIRDLTGETVTLHERWGDNRRISHVIEGVHEVRQIPAVGSCRPLLVGSSGKVMMAYLEPKERERIIEETQWPFKSPSGLMIAQEDFRADLNRVRAQGYAITHGESVSGVAGASAPILGANGFTAAALTVSGPAFRCTPQYLQRHIPSLVKWAREISTLIGGETICEDKGKNTGSSLF